MHCPFYNGITVFKHLFEISIIIHLKQDLKDLHMRSIRYDGPVRKFIMDECVRDKVKEILVISNWALYYITLHTKMLSLLGGIVSRP